MNFAELEKTDVTKHIEKKGRFSYLSWPFAVSSFRKACPSGRWEINKFDGLPYMKTDQGAFVSVTVWPDIGAESLYYEQVHPVLNHQNKPIPDPNPFDINTSIQRCLVKAIAIATGIGLHIYAGEDLPSDENGGRQNTQPSPSFKKKPPAKKPAPKRKWTPDEANTLADMSRSIGIAEEDKVMFTGWLAKRLGADTFNDIPAIGKAGFVINNFDSLYDEFMTENKPQ